MDTSAIAALAAKAQALPGTALPQVSAEHELHIDGDYAAYYFSGNDETTISAAKAKLLDYIRTVQQYGGVGGRTVVHLSSSGTDKGRRYKIATVKPYQGQRDSSRRPKNWEALRNWLEDGLPGSVGIQIKMWLDREADDGVAASARFALSKGRTPVISSRDKDFRMFGGLHVVWTTLDVVRVPANAWEVIGPDGEVYGHKWFWLQMLQGDSADHIPGLEMIKGKKGFKTCGPSCASDVLQFVDNNLDAFFNVSVLYEDYYGDAWADRFVEQAALLWMRNDNKAEVDNFMQIIPQPEKVLLDAVQRLKDRL